MEYTVSVVGLAGSGKTTYITRLGTGEFINTHIPTQLSVSRLAFHTNYGVSTITVTEYGGTFECKQTAAADGVIVMFDEQDDNFDEKYPKGDPHGHRERDYKIKLAQIQDHISRVDLHVPIVVVATHQDLCNSYGRLPEFTRGCETVDMYHISSKTNHDFEKPWLSLLRKMSGHADLKFVNAPVIVHCT